jgi:hypothetical protein
MATQVVPHTLRQAVNALLNAVGLANVNTLEDTKMDEVVTNALEHINTESVTLQSKVWYFNQDTDFPINPDPITGEVLIPDNSAACVISERSRYLYLTERGGKMWDKQNHTFNIGKTVYVDITQILDFDDCPQPIRWAITCAAGVLFGVKRAPDATTYRFTSGLADAAFADALKYDNDARSRSPEENPHLRAMRRR